MVDQGKGYHYPHCLEGLQSKAWVHAYALNETVDEQTLVNQRDAWAICGRVRVGGVQASVNPKVETVEELQARRKNLHLGMMKLAKEDLNLVLQAAYAAFMVPPKPPQPHHPRPLLLTWNGARLDPFEASSLGPLRSELAWTP